MDTATTELLPAPTAEARIRNWNALIGECVYDPLKYVMSVFRWGDPMCGLGSLHKPRGWQIEMLEELGAMLKDRAFDGNYEDSSPPRPIRMAVVSGRGPGKGTTLSWLMHYFMDVWPHTIGTVTAPTQPQLRGKLFFELAVWQNRKVADLKSRLHISSSKLLVYRKDARDTWWIQGAVPQKGKPMTVQGQHNRQGIALNLYDEASGVEDQVFENLEASGTEGLPISICMGNGNNTTGFFHKIHTRRRSAGWWRRSIDTREVEGVNKETVENFIEEFGEDSDFVRIHVRGLFPERSSTQLIPASHITDAQSRVPHPSHVEEPLIFGIDVGFGGQDRTVLWSRRGSNARDAGPIKFWEKNDFDNLGPAIMEEVHAYRPDAVVVDNGGSGRILVQKLRKLHCPNLHAINLQAAAFNRTAYANMRCDAYHQLADGIQHWLCIPEGMRDDEDIEEGIFVGTGMADRLRACLEEIQYGERNSDRKLLIEDKKEIRKRLGRSPDESDSLMMTFCVFTPGLEVERERSPHADASAFPYGLPSRLQAPHIFEHSNAMVLTGPQVSFFDQRPPRMARRYR